MPDPFYSRGGITLYVGDCREVAAQLEPESISAVCTDPPYGLEFMGKEWDRPWAVNAKASVGFAGREDNLTLPSHRDSRNANCRTCGGRQRGAKRCTCDRPNWDRSPQSDMREFQAWFGTVADALYPLLTPGAHLLAFGGTRTFYRIAVAIEDAGFEVRDTLMWLYGSGFPKSLDVSKAIDKAAGREGAFGEPKSPAHAGWIERGRMRGENGHEGLQRPWMNDEEAVSRNARKYEPATPEAEQWQGWGTALKPAYEPVILARKPLSGTVAATVLAHGTGALNVDACRVGYQSEADKASATPQGRATSKPSAAIGAEPDAGRGMARIEFDRGEQKGRWPSNVLLDPEAAAALDEMSGERKSGKMKPTHTTAQRAVYGQNANGGYTTMETYGDTGGASRFFPVLGYSAEDAHTILPCYNSDSKEECTCGDELIGEGNTSAGKRMASNGDNSHTDGCGSKHTVQSQTDTKSTISTRTRSTTTCPTCNASPLSGTTTTTNASGKITEPSTALNIDAANGATNTSRSTSSRDARPEATTATASRAALNTSGSGDELTENTSTPRSASTTGEPSRDSFFPVLPVDDPATLRFLYSPKASRAERNAGLDGLPERESRRHGDTGPSANAKPSGQTALAERNHHPTVKPLALMRWLVTLVTPPGGVVFDPFAGSGSTLVAAAQLGIRAVGIELSEEYAEIAARRIDHALDERAKRPAPKTYHLMRDVIDTASQRIDLMEEK